MYLSKLIYEELKKQLNENRILSKHLNKIDREHFVFIKKDLFSKSDFEKLDKTKKLLFSDGSDYENKKFIFEEIDDFFKLRRFLIASAYLFAAKRLFLGKAALSENFNFTFFKNSPKKFLLKTFLFSLFSFAVLNFEKKYFALDFSSKIKIDSRLGIFLWFESNYRIGLLNTNTINFLDESIQAQFNLVNKDLKSELNEELFHKLIFYALLKQHFYSFITCKFLVNVIFPLMNFEKNRSKLQKEKFLFSVIKQNFETMQKEKFFSYNSELNEEIDVKKIGIISNLKNLISSGVGESGLIGLDYNSKDKLFLNENSLPSLFRIEELNQIFLNDYMQESLRNFYVEYKSKNL
jgi:hypothetical protein